MRSLSMAGLAAAAVLLQLPALHAQGSGAAQQQQAIPDAPKPNTVPLGPVAPGKGTPSTTAQAPVAPTGDEGAPPSALPPTPAQAAAAETAADQGPAPEIGTDKLFTLQLRTNFVDVPFTVKDRKGGLVPGLTWRDVRVYEDGVRQHMAVFTSDPIPLSIVLVIDQSLQKDVMTRVNNSLAAVQGAFSPYDEVAVMTYNNGPKLQDGFTAGQSARLTAVIERSKTEGRDFMYYAPGEGLGGGINVNNGTERNMTPLTANGGGSTTANTPIQQREVHTLNDAILAAGKELSHVANNRRRIIYVISDGKEYGSQAKTKEVIRYLQTNKIAVYATLVGDSSVEGLGFISRLHVPLMMRDNNLTAFTNATGGQAFADYRQKGIETSFAKVTEQVRSQYTVGYYTGRSALDDRYRKLEVQVMRPGLEVIAKDGYYPSASTGARPNYAPVATP